MFGTMIILMREKIINSNHFNRKMFKSTTVLIILSQLIVEFYFFIDRRLHEKYSLCIQIKFRNLLKDLLMIRGKYAAFIGM